MLEIIPYTSPQCMHASVSDVLKVEYTDLAVERLQEGIPMINNQHKLQRRKNKETAAADIAAQLHAGNRAWSVLYASNRFKKSTSSFSPLTTLRTRFL
ncbi:hypothetical protein BDR04DRAFT_1165097 [Suillus decipiens]|nr:hypothetical protein BDR04DRAFT_1165097 [Suillus decipiens]